MGLVLLVIFLKDLEWFEEIILRYFEFILFVLIEF